MGLGLHGRSFSVPNRFSRELGFAHLIAVHRNLRITESQRARFVDRYLHALDEADIPADKPFRQPVRQHDEFGSQGCHAELQRLERR
jgi:hemoglobin